MRDHFLQHVREVLEDDDDGGAGVGELVLELARGVERVGIHHDETGAQRAVYRDRVLQRVRHHDGDAIALLEAAAVLQERSELHRQDIELAEGHGFAHLDISIAHGVDGEPALDELLERGILIYVDLWPNARRIRLEPMFFHDDPSSTVSQASSRVCAEQLAAA